MVIWLVYKSIDPIVTCLRPYRIDVNGYISCYFIQNFHRPANAPGAKPGQSLGDMRRRSWMQCSSRDLPHWQQVGALKRQHGRGLPDPGKESFELGSHQVFRTDKVRNYSLIERIR